MLCLYIVDNKLVMSVYATIKNRKFIMISDYLINARKGTIFFSIPTKNFNNPEMCRSERLVSNRFLLEKILPLQILQYKVQTYNRINLVKLNIEMKYEG